MKLMFFILITVPGRRKSNAFLDVPSINLQHLQINEPDDEDNYRLRTFSSSKGGELFTILFRVQFSGLATLDYPAK